MKAGLNDPRTKKDVSMVFAAAHDAGRNRGKDAG